MRIAHIKFTLASLDPLTILLIILTYPVTGPTLHRQEGGRFIPPSNLKCDRNDLTLYDGKVLNYRRSQGRTYLRIRTSFDTTESVTIRHPGTDDPSQFYLLNAGPFTRDDWRLIEKRRGVLKPGMRANVWVCRGNPANQPVVDWRPDDSGSHPKSR